MPTPQDYRNLELEAAAATAVGRGQTAVGTLIKVGLPLGAVAVAGFMIYGSTRPGPRNMTAPDREEFVTAQFPSPALGNPRPATDPGIIVVPPAPPPPEPLAPPPPAAPPALVPAPPPPEPPLAVVPREDDEGRRVAELERQRLEEERRRWERFQAPQVIADHVGPSAEAGREAGTGAIGGSEDDPNRRFLASVSGAGVEVARAGKLARIDALIAQGTMIRGVLETAVQSDLPGMVRAVTTENV